MKALTLTILIALASFSTSANSIIKSLSARKGIVINHPTFGEFNYYSGGQKGLILCFHGRGGSAGAWAKKKENKTFLNQLKRQGFRYLCPSSKNRKTKMWNATNNFKNADVTNVDRLLKFLGEDRKRLFLVGHSNGGGFVSRFSLISRFAKNIKAIQYSNSTGIKAYLQHRSYKFPTRYTFASCDKIVSVNRVNQNANLLSQKLGV